jgi:hypothetical protein
MVELRNAGTIPDRFLLFEKLDGQVIAEVCDLKTGVVPEPLECHIRDLRTCAKPWQDFAS